MGTEGSGSGSGDHAAQVKVKVIDRKSFKVIRLSYCITGYIPYVYTPCFSPICCDLNTTRIPTPTLARHVIPLSGIPKPQHRENRAEWDGRNLGTKWVMYLVRAHSHFLSFWR